MKTKLKVAAAIAAVVGIGMLIGFHLEFTIVEVVLYSLFALMGPIFGLGLLGLLVWGAVFFFGTMLGGAAVDRKIGKAVDKYNEKLTKP